MNYGGNNLKNRWVFLFYLTDKYQGVSTLCPKYSSQ